YAWADPIATPFTLEPGARTAGAALLKVPIELECPPPGTRVLIPRAFVPYRRLLQEREGRPTLQARDEVEQRLRFQLPPSVLPLRVTRARLALAIRAAAHRVTVAWESAGGRGDLLSVERPADPIRLDVTRDDLLRPDAQGGLTLHLTVSPLPQPGGAAG